MTTARRTLETAPYGSPELLDAVLFACEVGGELEAVMEVRLAFEVRRVAEQDRRDAEDLAEHWPSVEPKTKRKATAGETKKYKVPREPERRVA